jgi:hypothetical protein
MKKGQPIIFLWDTDGNRHMFTVAGTAPEFLEIYLKLKYRLCTRVIKTSIYF